MTVSGALHVHRWKWVYIIWQHLISLVVHFHIFVYAVCHWSPHLNYVVHASLSYSSKIDYLFSIGMRWPQRECLPSNPNTARQQPTDALPQRRTSQFRSKLMKKLANKLLEVTPKPKVFCLLWKTSFNLGQSFKAIKVTIKRDWSFRHHDRASASHPSSPEDPGL